jgi:membrane protease YdiL (CAAX protease family)
MFIAIAESVTTFTNPVYGVSLHAVILFSLLTLSALRYSENPPSSLFLSLSLAPLIRIISLSLPLAYFPRYAWYLVAGLAVLLATVTLMRVEGLGFREVGVTLNKPLMQAAVGLTGIPFGIIEYHILRPEPLAVGSLFENALLAIALIFFTGFAEELVFRGVMQRSAVEAFGWKTGVLGVNAVFSILHIGWLSILDVLFVFTIGLLFGFMTFKTGSIVGVSLSHGLTNVFLFLVMPAR